MPRVLVVDDEIANRELLEGILAEAGYVVEQADSGEAALARATSKPPDLILLDLMMPGLSGFEVCRQLKAHPAAEGVPIIVVTALGQVKDKEAALTSGADDFVTKPVDPEDLRTRVGAMLKVRRPARRPRPSCWWMMRCSRAASMASSSLTMGSRSMQPATGRWPWNSPGAMRSRRCSSTS